MAVRLMICYARSGGTVLNQCLGCLPHVVIMSEVNPLGGGGGKGPVQYKTVKSQAKQWYGIELHSNDFVESVLELEEVCNNMGYYLVIRDWTFVNFVPCVNNKWNPPNSLLTLEMLKHKCEVLPFAFIRDAIDVWISRGISIEDFFGPYLRYIKAIREANIPIFKYEDFCRDPDKVMQQICECIHLEYSPSYRKYASFQNVNGDVQVRGGSRGAKQRKIALLPRRYISKKKIEQVNRCKKMIEANTLMGYPVSYYAVPRECGYVKRIKEWIKKYIKILKVLLKVLERIGLRCFPISIVIGQKDKKGIL